MLSWLLLAVDLSYFAPDYGGFTGRLDDTIPGDVGGQVVFRGSLDDGVGTVSSDFQSYSDGDLTIDGKLTHTFRDPGNLTSPSLNYSSRFERVRFSGDGPEFFFDVTFDGLIRREEGVAGPGLGIRTTEVALVFEDHNFEEMFEFDNLRIVRSDERPTFRNRVRFAETLSGRFYAGETGYLDFEHEGPWLYESRSARLPFKGASLRVRGADSVLRLLPLNSRFLTLLFDGDADGSAESSQRIAWDIADQSIDVDGISVHAGTDARTRPNEPVRLNGALSVSSDGLPLSYAWQLTISPPGSEASLAFADSPRPEFQADTIGDYLVTVVVSDGVRVAHDGVRVRVVQELPSSDGRNQPVASFQRPPDVGPGGSVWLDARGSGNTLFDDSEELTWEVIGPDYEEVEVRDQGDGRALFVPVHNGLHAVRLSGGQSVSTGTVREQIRWISVGTDFSFYPPVQLTTGTVPTRAATGRFLDDGSESVAMLARMPGSTPDSVELVEILRGSGPADTQVERQSAAVADEVWLTGDINDDGLDDVLAGGVETLHVLISDGGGGFALGNYATDIVCGLAPRGTRLFDASGDGLPDILFYDACAEQLVTYLQQDGGVFGLPQRVAAPGEVAVIGDLNSDGIVDLATIEDRTQFFGARSTYSIWHGQPDGSWSLSGEIALPLSPGPIVIGIGDINDDGKDDLALLNGRSTAVSVQRDNGTLAGASWEVQFIDSLTPTNPSLRIADMNGDGRRDVVIDPSGTIVLQGEDGLFRRSVTLPYLSLPAFWGYQTSMDINQDGLTDLVSRSNDSSSFFLGTDGPTLLISRPPDQ